MTLPVPLSVRLVTTDADRHVESELHDLSFRSVVPGGFASARMSLNRDLNMDPAELQLFGLVKIYDTRNGQIVWEGRIEDAGRGAGVAGAIREIAAVGGAAHASDRVKPHIFVDTSTEDWEPATNNQQYIDISEILSNDVPAIKMTCPEGTSWAQTEYGEVWYRRLVDTGQRLSRVVLSWDTGVTTPNNRIETFMSIGASGAGTQVETQDWDDTGGTQTVRIGADWAAGTAYDVPRVHALRNGATLTIPAGTRSAQWFIPCVRTVLYDVDGSERDTSGEYTTNYVRAHEIVNDLLGRILTDFDGTGTDAVATNTYDIDQLAYREGVTAAEVFADLMQFHPDHYWAAWERIPTNAYRFEWTTWPTTIRYEADVIDGFDSPGSGASLWNAVSIRWVGAQGRVRHSRRTSTVDVLDDAGLTRESYIDLKFDAGSSANAIQAGDSFLEDHAVVTNTGKLTIARPILDRTVGRMVMPWELRPGNLIRVRGVQPTLDALNTTTRNAVTVFKITAVDYDTSSAAANLELDSNPIDLTHLLARSQLPVTIAKQKR